MFFSHKGTRRCKSYTIRITRRENRENVHLDVNYYNSFYYIGYNHVVEISFFLSLVMRCRFSVNQFLPFAALLLTVGLFALSGCQTLSPKPSSPPPVSIPAPPVYFNPQQVESDIYSAFRPIMPGELFPPPPTQIARPEATDPQTITIEEEPQSDLPLLAAIDELNQRITELEAQLEEAKQSSPILEESLPEMKPAKPLPIINKPGVHIFEDDSQNVRFEIMDKTLFVPNGWQLSAEGEEVLRVISAEIRAADPHVFIDIEGHTDNLMSDPNNPTQKHEISAAKTRAAMNFFVETLRWDAAKISTSSFGRSRPVAENGNPEGRARNNRIEIVVRAGPQS